MTTKQRTIPSSPVFVLAEPFRRLVNEWLEKRASSWMQAGNKSQCRQSPLEIAASALFPDPERMGAQRNLYALLHERREIHFDLADRIVCKLLGDPGLWVSNPELAAIYDKVNLLAIDSVKPTCDEAQEEVYEKVRRTFTRCDRNTTKTAKQLGLSKTFVDYVIAGPPRQSVAA